MKKSPFQVLIVDDFAALRRWVRSKLEGNGHFQIVGEAADGLEAVQKASELKPDLILLDLGLPKLNGIEVASRLSKSVPTAKILFLSQNDDTTVAKAALSDGAKGYLLKAHAETELLPAIEEVCRGGTFVSSLLVL